MAKKKNKSHKQALWLSLYLDRDNVKTFLNATESAKQAQYKAKSDGAFRVIGHENLTKLNDDVARWMEEEGLADPRLKGKMVELLDAKETRIINVKGKIIEDFELPEGVRIVIKSQMDKVGSEGIRYIEDYTVVAIDMEARGLQATVLDKAFRHKGLYNADKQDNNYTILHPAWIKKTAGIEDINVEDL